MVDFHDSLASEDALNHNRFFERHFLEVKGVYVVQVAVAVHVELLLLDAEDAVVRALLGPVELQEVGGLNLQEITSLERMNHQQWALVGVY